jgi:hypothetical protein
MLTRDRKNRYRGLERKMVLEHKLRQFVFSGNIGGQRMAQLLVNIYPEMRKFARCNERPFVAIVTASRNIYLRMDSRGNVTEWEESQHSLPSKSGPDSK